jgi:phosphoribosyl-dephospho-CoA transferase
MFARHDLVWLSDWGWQCARDCAPADCHEAIDRWRRADWPAIVRRADADLAPGWLSVGIALPPHPVDGARMRIGLRVPESGIHQVRSPLPLTQAIEAAPAAWRRALAALAARAAGDGLALRVYGAVALQAWTRQPYLTAASDIDLLFHPRTCAQLQRGLDLFDVHARRLPLDGEAVFPGGQAVAWKELTRALRAANGCRVLVKEMQRVSLATVTALLATMQEARDACADRRF